MIMPANLEPWMFLYFESSGIKLPNILIARVTNRGPSRETFLYKIDMTITLLNLR